LETLKPKDGYSREEVRRILRIPESRLRSWERRGWCENRASFGFADLIALRSLQNLRENRIPPGRIEDSLLALSRKLPSIERPLWELKFVTSGRQVAVELPSGKMEALTGQMLFNFDTAPMAAVKTIPRNTKQDASLRLQEAENWFRRGLEVEERGGSPEHAIAAYRRAVEMNPGAAGAWVNIGTLYYRRGDLREAEHSYRQALRSSPNYPLAHFNLGNICEETSRLDEAINHYKIALRLQPSYADAHYNLALVYERSGEAMRAARHWRDYLKLDPSSPWAGIARQQLSSLVTVTPGGRSSDSAS
jgi:tetratricopeptide (TPR) repeat protein